MRKNKTAARHNAALDTGTIGKAFIRGITRALNNCDRRAHGYSASRAFGGMCDGALDAIVNRVENERPRVDATLAAQGLEWLRSPRVNRKLDQVERDIVADFSHFTLSGFHDAGNAVAFMIPVYTVHANPHYLDPNDPRPGRSFSYYTGSWQSGIPLTVLEQ